MFPEDTDSSECLSSRLPVNETDQDLHAVAGGDAPCTDAQEDNWLAAAAAAAALHSQVAPMPTYYSPSVHVEERAGSIVVISRNSSSGSDLLNRQKSERNDEGNFSKVIEDENSFLAACAYHEETVDATKEANRMFEQQSDVSQGKRRDTLLLVAEIQQFVKF